MNEQLLNNSYNGLILSSSCLKYLDDINLAWLVGIYTSSGYFDCYSGILSIRHVNSNLINKVSQLLCCYFGELELSIDSIDSIYILTIDGKK